jgi:hypothetical protein
MKAEFNKDFDNQLARLIQEAQGQKLSKPSIIHIPAGLTAQRM